MVKKRRGNKRKMTPWGKSKRRRNKRKMTLWAMVKKVKEEGVRER